MEIKADIRLTKTATVKLASASEKIAKNGRKLIRLLCKKPDGSTIWFSNWEDVWNNIKFDLASAQEGDELQITYNEHAYDNGTVFNNYVDIKKTSTQQNDLPF